jgi:hypothetical protein
MPDHNNAAVTSPPLRSHQSTMGTLVITGPDGQRTTTPIAIVHAPGVELPDTVVHDGEQCGCRP